MSTTPTLPNIDEIANLSNLVLVANLVLLIVRELIYFLNTVNEEQTKRIKSNQRRKSGSQIMDQGSPIDQLFVRDLCGW